MNRALQCPPSFQNFLEGRGFEKVKNGRSSGGLLATKKEKYRFSATPVNAYLTFPHQRTIVCKKIFFVFL